MDKNVSYLFFPGYYDVAAASDMLSMYNIRNQIVRAPISKQRGCSYAVRIEAEDKEMCRYILKNKNIRMI